MSFDEHVRRLSSGDRKEVADAARWLGDLGDQGALSHLIRLLGTTDDNGLKNAAAIGLQALANPIAVAPLLHEIRDPKNADYTGTLIWALGSMNARSAVVDLARVICSSEFEAVLMAIGVMHGFEGPLVPDQLGEAMQILEDCLTLEHTHDWRAEMVAEAIAFLSTYDAGA